MFVLHSLPIAIFFCIITMLGWGSWANTQKLSGKDQWRFELYYWDYAIGVLIFGFVFAATFGSMGNAGQSALANLSQASQQAVGYALISGAIFNISNIMLVVAIDAAGMAVAFPIGVGLALVIGTVESYLQSPKGNPTLLFSGVALIVFAMIMSSLAYRKLPQAEGRKTLRGLIFAVLAGCIMGSFYPQLLKSISPNFNTAPIQPGTLTPYVALAIFGIGVFLSNFIVNSSFGNFLLKLLTVLVAFDLGFEALSVVRGFAPMTHLHQPAITLFASLSITLIFHFMRAGKLTYADYFRGTPKLHLIGILGGVIWMIALCFNVIASGVAGPAISYALGQGATLIAAIWGVLVWKELAAGPKGTGLFTGLMFAGYAAGLILIGLASQ